MLRFVRLDKEKPAEAGLVKVQVALKSMTVARASLLVVVTALRIFPARMGVGRRGQ